MMGQIKTQMRLTDDTKGALIYSAVNGEELIGMRDIAVSRIYVRKDKIEGQPKEIILTLDY